MLEKVETGESLDTREHGGDGTLRGKDSRTWRLQTREANRRADHGPRVSRVAAALPFVPAQVEEQKREVDPTSSLNIVPAAH